MALITFSFTGTKVIKINGAASAASLTMAPGALVKCVSWTGGTTKGQSIRIKEIKSGTTVFYDRLSLSYGGRDVQFNPPIPVEGGLRVTTFPAGEAQVYLQ
jgi:hypothetical protein